ncbi:MAG: fumarate hydratase C-terminal domain-containing protein [Deltaproteobacteria bacterium]|nr:fumarate hydratase C-terminal domain-containing protein [Deltaproteobacteria bacterium]
MKILNTPVSAEEIRGLNVGDEVEICGVIVTGRDAAHKYLVENDDKKLKEILNGTFIYHCGPVVVYENGQYVFKVAGPTTSIREEPYQAEVIRKYNLRGVIGKGGMGKNTLEAMKDCGAVYLHVVGGAAVYIGQRIKKVLDVYKLEEFGVPEAMWVLQVEQFPAVVTMDSKGRSLHEEVYNSSMENYKRLLGKK